MIALSSDLIASHAKSEGDKEYYKQVMKSLVTFHAKSEGDKVDYKEVIKSLATSLAKSEGDKVAWGSDQVAADFTCQVRR